MLAGPPRLVSLVAVLGLFIITFSYIRLGRVPYPTIQFEAGQPTAALRGDPLDFGIPLRFKDGEAKPPGANYSWAIVVPKTKQEDLRWLQGGIPEAKLVVYEVDNPNAEYKVPKNKGREAMVRRCIQCFPL